MDRDMFIVEKDAEEATSAFDDAMEVEEEVFDFYILKEDVLLETVDLSSMYPEISRIPLGKLLAFVSSFRKNS